ncbi:conserved hypothetical protein-putative thiol-disulfide isomerase or thioredoxin [Candidatus Koribacter versatilis Ellin345]|uniref:Cytochrome c domain-containing protein n=2 Tax=Candidatus Korobacter versatilis TaxID=658062 RepID=Q1IKX9_KORVE|nr:conserved hypothetical protein-putative thiol-disulfide isomerase or thioredoxin [Candidatus Koribacter versatilis Ellin345]
MLGASAVAQQGPTFYKDVLPLLQAHCQSCHRRGEIAPMAFTTYEEVKPYADAMKAAVASKRMPPWFADPRCGRFSNDPSLSDRQIQTIVKWAEAHAPRGNPKDAPPAPRYAEGWLIPQPDAVFTMPVPVDLPAHGDVEYTYEIVPTHFSEGRWVQMSEIRPSSREHVHHAVVYIRPPASTWLRDAPLGKPFTAGDMVDPKAHAEALATTSDMLLVYAPGSEPDRWPDGMAKYLPAGSDLIFQMHYTTNGHGTTDQTSIGVVFSKGKPMQRVLTLQLTNHSFVIPPRTDNYEVYERGTLPNDATLLSFFPHMHLRGKKFEYDIVKPNGEIEPLLKVNYHFHWQLSYKLAQPIPLKAGTVLQAVATFDNSDGNMHNPDPSQYVKWGGQTYEEMMVGFFDVAVPATTDKEEFFERKKGSPHPSASQLSGETLVISWIVRAWSGAR